MSDALVLEYLSNRPSSFSVPRRHNHHHHHHHTALTTPTTATMSTPTTPFALVEPSPSHPPKMSFGRGGAGNRTSSRPLPPSELTVTTDTHSLHPNNPKNHGMPNYSTGRGGVGNMHGAGEERRMFSFDEELAKEGKVGAVPVYHVGRGGVGNAVDEMRRDSGESVGSKGSGASGMRGSLDWIRALGKKA